MALELFYQETIMPIVALFIPVEYFGEFESLIIFLLGFGVIYFIVHNILRGL